MTDRDGKHDTRMTTVTPASAAGTTDAKPRRSRRGRILLCAAALGAVVFFAWLAAWLVQRSLATPAKLRAMQSWLDENLNADVSLLGDMTVRLNLVRDSRLVVSDTEIEHPNPTFSGKFATINRISTRASPLAMAWILPRELDIRIDNLNLLLEQAENGEWSHDGLMRPLASGETPFPFLLPKISRWKANVDSGSFTVRRRGYELKLGLAGDVEGRPGGGRIAVRAPRLEYAFGRVGVDGGGGSVRTGAIDALNLTLSQSRAGDMPVPVPGRAEARVSNLPVSTLPFFVQAIPTDEVPGVFNGLVRYAEHPGAAGALFMEGELNDVPLGVFGLPRNAPVRLTWPIAPGTDGLPATVHMGPSGYGAFTMTADLARDGLPRRLSLKSDIAALDDIPAFFTLHSRWPDWLSRVFPALVWQTGTWRGFGWQGTNLVLELSRSMTGLTLNGEAGLFGGNVRLSMTPDQPEAPITIAAERLDSAQLSLRLSQMLPDALKASVTGGGVTATWRGFPSSTGSLDEWGAGMVWAKPVIDLNNSGAFWLAMAGAALPVAGALPEWGGGEAGELLGLAAASTMELDQFSIVPERYPDGSMGVEFRGYGGAFGQVTGVLERRADGTIEGEFLLAGTSRLLEALSRANADLATALYFLANDAEGLRVSFIMPPGGEMSFSHHFLDDAKRIRAEIANALAAEAAESADGAESGSEPEAGDAE